MEAKIYRCPACGTSLEVNENTRAIICPSCGSTITLERNENPVTPPFMDSRTGTVIGNAITPTGWPRQGEIIEVWQSMARPFTAKLQATSPDNTTILFANTGESFHQIKSGMLEFHHEGGFDKKTKTPLRKYVDTSVYLDQMASNILHTSFQLLGSYALPRENLKDIEKEKAKDYAKATSIISSLQIVDYSVIIQNVLVDGLVRAYQYQDNTKEKILLLGSEMKGLEYSYESAGALLLKGFGDFLKKSMNGTKENTNVENQQQDDPATKLKSMFDFAMSGGIVGAQRRKQHNSIYPNPNTQEGQSASLPPFSQSQSKSSTGSYVDWESTMVYGMILDAPLTKEKQEIYDNFVHSFVINPAIPARMEDIAKQVTAQMKQQIQQEQQHAFETYQRNHAAQQAVFNSYNQAYWNRAQQQDASRRTAYQNKMASDDRIRNNFSEAIRGVNSYTRPDGSTIEHSAGADCVFVKNNDPSTTRGASFGDNVPFGWTELKKKD